MPGNAQARVDDAAITAVRFADGARQPVWPIGNEDQMDVVGHQALAPHRHAMFSAFHGQEIAIKLVIGVAEENRLAAIAALRDMMRQSGNDEAGDAGHTRDERVRGR
jgi:hypothetical protein